MRELDVAEITGAVKDLAIRTNIHLGEDVKKALRDAMAS